jgi:hypothetical protein
MREFRPSTPADGAAIAALLQTAGLHPVVRPEVERWKYWQQRTDWAGDRSFVLADNGTLIAHGALVPGELTWTGGRAQVLFMFDWAADPAATGAGVSLMKRIGRMADGMLAVGGSSQTRELLPHLGFRPAGEITGYVRAVRPWRIFGAATPLSARLLARFVRSVVWAASASSRGSDGFRVRRITPRTVAELHAALPAATDEMAVFSRSEASLRHALECPLMPMELHALERSGRVQGYFLLAIAGRQARLADCWMVSRDPADWRSLVQCAVQRARQHPQVAEVTAWASDALLSGCLEQCGFHARNSQPVSLMMRPGSAAPSASVRVQMLETDMAYLDPRGESLWM